MSSFNFFIVIAALLTTGLAGTLKSDFEHHYVGVALALCLLVISFIFWKVDQRVRYLIEHGEDALKAIEEVWMRNKDFIDPRLALFRTEEERTGKIRGLNSWNLWKCHLLHGICFGTVYWIFALLGVLGIIATVVKWTT